MAKVKKANLRPTFVYLHEKRETFSAIANLILIGELLVMLLKQKKQKLC